MDEQNVATNIEVDNSQVAATPVTDNTATNIEVDNSLVVDQATPMDSNTTYDNLPREETTPTANTPVTNMDPLQQMVDEAVTNYRDNMLQSNAGVAMNNFLTKEYNYDPSEAGTYWVAGAINDVDTQMSFLNTLIHEDMYDEMDLQKYYYDSTLATARAYAAQKKKETAYGFYRAAQERAIAEAGLTGWYMPAEGNYMLGQYTVAQNKVEDPNATAEDLAKANHVINVTEQWFKANQIGTRGIKCLSMMNYEENVRHNTIMGQLQHEANQIQGASAGASAALARIKLAEFKFQVEEEELQTGVNYSKMIGIDNKDFLGHDTTEADYHKYQNLRGTENLDNLLQDNRAYKDILTAWGSSWIKEQLGDERYDDYEKNYNMTQFTQWVNSSDKDLDLTSEEGQSMLNAVGKAQRQTLSSGREIKSTDRITYTLYNNTDTQEKEVRFNIIRKDGTVIPLTNKDDIANIKLANGKTVGEVLPQSKYAYKEGNIETPNGHTVSYGAVKEADYNLANELIKNRKENLLPSGANDALEELYKNGGAIKPGAYADPTGNGQVYNNIIAVQSDGKLQRMNTRTANIYNNGWADTSVAGIGGGDFVDVDEKDIHYVYAEDSKNWSQNDKNAIMQQMIVNNKKTTDTGYSYTGTWTDANNKTYEVTVTRSISDPNDAKTITLGKEVQNTTGEFQITEPSEVLNTEEQKSKVQEGGRSEVSASGASASGPRNAKYDAQNTVSSKVNYMSKKNAELLETPEDILGINTDNDEDYLNKLNKVKGGNSNG